MFSVLKLIGILCGIIADLLLTFSIKYDAQASRIKNVNVWAVLTFFFPIIVGVIYAFSKKEIKKMPTMRCANCNAGAEPYYTTCPNCSGTEFIEVAKPNVKKLNSKSVKCFAFAVVFTVAFAILFAVSGSIGNSVSVSDNHYGYTVDGEKLFYDQKGISYIDSYEVPFYDNDGNVYTYNYDEKIGDTYQDEKGKTYPYYDCYVDSDGYFYFDKDNKLQYGVNKKGDYRNLDSDGNVYFEILDVSFDKDGNIVSQDGKILN